MDQAWKVLQQQSQGTMDINFNPRENQKDELRRMLRIINAWLLDSKVKLLWWITG